MNDLKPMTSALPSGATVAMAAEAPRPPPYLRLRQVCLVATQLAPAVDAWRSILGLEVCHRDPNVAVYGLENALFACGQAFVEIVAPTRPGTAVGRFIERSGGDPDRAGGYMAIFDCDDPLARRAQALRLGVRVAHDIEQPGYRGVQLHPRDCRATMLSFDHSLGGDVLGTAYAPAGPHWRGQQRLDRVQGLPLVELSSPEPEALARHWSALTGVALQLDGRGQPRLNFDLGAVAVRGAAAGTPEQLSALYLQVSDAAAVRAAARRLGCAEEGSGFRLCGVRIQPCEYSSLP